VRDRTTWSLYGVFAVWGWFLYAFNPAVPLIGDDLGVTNAVAGLHGTALAVGTVAAGLVSARVVAWRGRRAALWVGTVAVVAGVVLIVSSGVIAGTLVGAVVVGVGGTLLVNVANAALSDKHGRASGAAITEANGLGALVGAAAPFALGVLVGAGSGWQPALLVVIALLAVVSVAMPALPSPTRPTGTSRTDRSLPGRYWWAWGVLVLLIAVEFSYSVWATTLVADRTGVSTGTATTTLTVLILCLGLGRVVGARLALRVRPGILLMGAIVVTAGGWAVLWTATSLPVAVVAMAISGFGMAFHFPLGVSRSLEAAGGRTDLGSARIALGGGLAIGLAPFVLGAVTDVVGVHGAFLLVPALLGAAALLLVGGRFSADRHVPRTAVG
jgi:predicted MFS family arabinose efflux permease